jgi:hypothetical protein
MTRSCRLSIASALISCLIGSHLNAALIASSSVESSDRTGAPSPGVQTSLVARAASPASPAAGTAPLFGAVTDGSWFTFRKDEASQAAAVLPATDLRAMARAFRLELPPSNAFAAAQVYRGRPYPARRDRAGSIAALAIGAAATITGAALLIYANRPECRNHEFATGCGYGTKVVGGAVLAGGAVGLTIGAITWR